jgi:hypothetical protein
MDSHHVGISSTGMASQTSAEYTRVILIGGLLIFFECGSDRSPKGSGLFSAPGKHNVR